jgi:tRNA(Arg) A34 adenosine deaminase TadA
MCLGAIYWARPERVYYACTKDDAASAGFDDAFVYKEIDLGPENRQIPFVAVDRKLAMELFQNWIDNPDKTVY